jgi:hypothetical protein
LRPSGSADGGEVDQVTSRGDTPSMTRTHENSTLRWWWRHS